MYLLIRFVYIPNYPILIIAERTAIVKHKFQIPLLFLSLTETAACGTLIALQPEEFPSRASGPDGR